MEKVMKNKKIIIILLVFIIVLTFIFTVNKVTKNSGKGNALAGSSNSIGVTSVEVEKNNAIEADYTINDGGTSVSFTATLGMLGDSVNYILSIKNTSISPSAIIDSVDITGDNKTFKYLTDAEGKIINKGETEKIEFKITYDNDENVSSSNEITVKFKFRKNGLTYGDTTIKPLSKDDQNNRKDGLYNDFTESGRYFYSGSNPNNDIVFNGEPYRILAIEPDGRIKIIKAVSIGQIKWNVELSNNWKSSSLKGYLESTWLPTQSSGQDYKYLSKNNEWYIGTISDNSTRDFTKLYGEEKTATAISPIGLISASEFLKSRYTGSTSLNYSSKWWTISPYGSSDALFAQGSIASVSYNVFDGQGSGGVFPVIYLKSSVSLTGTGTASDPYCIKGSSCPSDLNFTQREK